MIPYTIVEPFMLGPIHINFYGIMFAFGTLMVILLAKYFGEKNGFSKDKIEDLSIYLLLGTIIGARLFYVFFYWPAQTPFYFLDIFKVWNGGLAFFGGFIGAIIAGYLFCKKHKLDFIKLLDVFVIPVIVGHIFGRVGDYLTGGHPGKITDLPWSIFLDGALRHPVVLYEIIGLLTILGIIFLIKNKLTKIKKGVLFAIYLSLYSIQRLILDFFRIESTDPRTLGLTPTQILVIFLLISSIIYIIKSLKNKNILEEPKKIKNNSKKNKKSHMNHNSYGKSKKKKR